MQTHEWEALLQGATPGPWEWHGGPDPDMRFIYSDEGGMCMTVEPVGSAYRDADPVLAAAAPEAVAEVIRLRRELEKLKGDLNYSAMCAKAQGESGAVQTTAAKRLTRILEGGNDE